MRRTLSGDLRSFVGVAAGVAATGQRWQDGLKHTVEPEPGVEPEDDLNQSLTDAASFHSLDHSVDAESLAAAAGEVAKYDFTHAVPLPAPVPNKPRLAFSACLLGHEVRYNKGHCKAKALVDLFTPIFQLVPVCPEMDIGLGAPRPTLRLVMHGKPETVESAPLQKIHQAEGSDKRLTMEMVAKLTDLEEIGKFARLYCPDNGEDLTDKMAAYGKMKAEELRGYGVDGFVLKKDSPSCGVARVPMYDRGDGKRKMRMAMGSFSYALRVAWPELPVAEEGWLCDVDARDNFMQQVLCHARWRAIDATDFKAVLKFHEQHKYILMAQDPQTLKDLGRFLAEGPKAYKAQDGAAKYYRTFFRAMKIMVSRGRHKNVLQHLAGHLKKEVEPEQYKDLLGSIDDFYEGLVPLVVPLQLMSLMASSSVRAKPAPEGGALEPAVPGMSDGAVDDDDAGTSSGGRFFAVAVGVVAIVAAILVPLLAPKETPENITAAAAVSAVLAVVLLAAVMGRGSQKAAPKAAKVARPPAVASPTFEKKTGGEILSLTQYLQGAPRSLKLHTAISERMEAKMPQAHGGD